ncbi:hypothetical protein B0H15DRAFT_955889 [Mycena belliarum]|uniref:Uncharacterized protein n=1 Tax=Mycena belliarum TaxID=1033014 RepID=A0AAD6XJU5_9AGAR|nr:hypothetical protein B0H15DRAFT_955889 [Mycena belliae]
MRARTHPGVLETQRALLSLWHDSSGKVSLASYFDRLRIRFPGDVKFALGPHVDVGSIERWEEGEYHKCFRRILEGGSAWREHDPYDAAPRVNARQDLYNALYAISRTPDHAIARQFSVFDLPPVARLDVAILNGPGREDAPRSSHAQARHGNWMLRPFFRARSPASASLRWEDRNALDLDGTAAAATHPHLRLEKTMVSMPRVEPGDQMIHAVEGYHGGTEDSSVMCIPAVPLTLINAHYLRDQRKNFLAGLPAPDFPGGKGESTFVGRATSADLYPDGRRAVGFEKHEHIGEEDSLLAEADRILAA